MKVILIITVLLLTVITATSSFSQDKLVVIPLLKSSESSKSIWGGGTVMSDGVLYGHFGKPFSVNKTQTGNYEITLQGYSGCNLGDHIPISAIISIRGLGFTSGVLGGNFPCPGNSSVSIATYNISGEVADMGFELILSITKKAY